MQYLRQGGFSQADYMKIRTLGQTAELNVKQLFIIVYNFFLNVLTNFCPTRKKFWETHKNKYKLCIYNKDVMHTKKGEKEILHVSSFYGNKQIFYRNMFI